VAYSVKSMPSFKNEESLLHTTSKTHPFGLLMHSIGGVPIDTRYIMNLISFS